MKRNRYYFPLVVLLLAKASCSPNPVGREAAENLESTDTQIETFASTDIGGGLDLDGVFVYAVNMGGAVGAAIRDANFSTEAEAGPGFTQSFSNVWNLGIKPEYGTSTEDNGFEQDAMRIVRYQTGTTTHGTVQMGGLKGGHRYKLQLLWHEVSTA